MSKAGYLMKRTECSILSLHVNKCEAYKVKVLFVAATSQVPATPGAGSQVHGQLYRNQSGKGKTS